MYEKITKNELIELQHFISKGYKYIAKNENQDIYVFKNEPYWYKNENCYGVWGIKECDEVYFDRTQDSKVILGQFEWLTIEQPLLIEDIIKDQ